LRAGADAGPFVLCPAAGGRALSLPTIRRAYERLLEGIVLVLMIALTILVIFGAAFRYLGNALTWYDEIASIGLVWLTYYGSALAALRGAHIGVPGFVNAMPPRLRLAVTLFAEAVVLAFFILLAIYGVQVLIVLEGEHLITLPEVSTQLTQSAIPIGATMFVIAELLRLPDVLRAARGGGFVDAETIEAMAHGAPDTTGSAGTHR
jgi:TRAP-type C4-dicarboxylate transport system permease small subunit